MLKLPSTSLAEHVPPYDELDRKTLHTQRKDSGILVSSFSYDENDNLTQLIDAKTRSMGMFTTG